MNIPAIFAEFGDSEQGNKARSYVSEHGLPNRKVEEFHYTDISRALGNNIATALAVDGTSLFDGLTADVNIHAMQNSVKITGENAALSISEIADFSGYKEDTATIITRGLATKNYEIALQENANARIIIKRDAGSRIALHIKVATGSRLEIIEEVKAQSGLSSDFVFAEIADNAILHRLIVSNNVGAKDYRKAVINVGANAEFKGFALSRGGEMVRFETDVHLLGEGAKCYFNSAYLLKHTQNDFTTTIYHHVPNCETNEIVRGIVADGANAVFQGKIQVERDAQKTMAIMEHRGLMIDEGARINAKPSLEIYADDVECSHANTIGALDESALFYMQARGISENSAKKLLIQAFINQVFDNLKIDEIRELLTKSVQASLEEIVG